MKKAFLLFVLFLTLSHWGWGQTNPTAANLSSGNYTFTGFEAGTTTTYPPSMQGHTYSEVYTISNLTNAPNGDAALVASTSNVATGSVRNEISNGISMLYSSGTKVGDILVAINTSGRTSVTVSWTAAQVNDVTTRQNAVRLQYRIGTSGNFTNVGSTDYITTLNGTNSPQTFTNISLPSTVENQSVVHLRWVYYDYNGSGSRDRIRIDEITISSSPSPPPTISLSSPSQVESGTVNQNATNVILSQFQAAVSTASATLNSLAFTSAGSYVEGDITNFKLYYNTSNTWSGASQIGTSITSSLGTGSHTFSSSIQSISSESTGYFWITCDVASGATPSNTINVEADPILTFASGTPSGSISAGGTQTFQEAIPAITISSPDPSVALGNIIQYTSNNVIYRLDLAVANTNATLSGLQITTTGTYSASDISNLKAWYSTDISFSSETDVLLSTKATSLSAGVHIFPTWTNQVINSGTTGYVFITTDLPCASTSGNTINVSAVTTSDVTFLSGNKAGTAYAGGTQTIIYATPNNVTSPASTVDDSKSLLTWTNPSDCYDEIMIIAKASSSITGSPSGDGSSYSASLTYGNGSNFDGGYVVYIGTTTPQTVTGLTNGTAYYYKFFSRKGTNWSNGTETSATPAVLPVMTELVVPRYMGSKTATGTNNARTPVAFCIQIDNLTPNTAYDVKPQLGLTSEANTVYGAGNIWSSTSFGSSVISNAFTTDGSGSSGPFWVFIQPTGNSSRFDAGQIHNLRIGYIANGGIMPSSPNFVGSKTITALDIASTARTTSTSDDGAFIKGSANAGTTGKYVLLFDNESGTGDPLFAYQIRTSVATSSTQSELPVSINDIYLQSGTSAIGDYPAVVPIGANNPNGVRRIEARNSDNTVYSYNTDADGIWYSGANTTNIARREVVTLTSQDAPVYSTTWNGTVWDNGEPSNVKNTVINGNLSLGSDVTTCGLVINIGKIFTIPSGKALTVSGTLTNSAGNGGLVIADGGSLITNGTVSGGATVSRTISGPAWHLMAAPVTGQSIFTGYTDMYAWDEVNYQWLNHNGGDFPDPTYLRGKGYLVSWAAGVTKDFAGTLNSGDFATGVGSVPALTYTSGKGNGFNLMGNPYPSALNGSIDTWTKTNVDNSIWVYNNGSYLTWNGTTGTLTGGIIPAMQGFWVKANATGASLTIPNTARTHSTQSYYKSAEALQDMILLSVEGNGYKDGIVVNFNDEATEGYDGAFDVLKMYGDAAAPQFFCQTGEKELSIDVLPYTRTRTIPLGLKVGYDNTYTLQVKENTFYPSVSIVLEDLKTGQSIDLQTHPEYTFNALSSDNASRFKLHFGGALGVEDPKTAEALSIYANDNQLCIAANTTLSGDVYVYNMVGQLLLQQKLENSALTRIAVNGPSGYYLVKVVTGQKTFTGKVFIR